MTQKPYETVKDLVTGREVPNVGPEENRQAVEKFLLSEKGYFPEDILVSVPFSYELEGRTLSSEMDLLVRVQDAPAMVIRCVAGSVFSYEREALAAARIAMKTPIPVAVATDGREASVLDTSTGKSMGKGMEAIPGRETLISFAREEPLPGLSPDKLQREKLIYRTYDSDTVNASRRMEKQ
ncbi:MAG: type I restriction enzyme HsdR N-terminal domain-containing protein [Thermodesulfobacteriota bacterium]